MAKQLKANGPSRLDGRGTAIINRNRRVFPHILSSGVHGNAMWPIRLRELRIDKLDFANLPPAFAGLLESFDGRNFKCNSMWISRGDGHPQMHHYPSGICATCVTSNSISSGHQSRTKTAAEPWVMTYAINFMGESEEDRTATHHGQSDCNFAGNFKQPLDNF